LKKWKISKKATMNRGGQKSVLNVTQFRKNDRVATNAARMSEYASRQITPTHPFLRDRDLMVSSSANAPNWCKPIQAMKRFNN
jgi:hypothetical protein